MKFSTHYANPRLPLWCRVVLYAVDHDAVQLDRGELMAAVDPQRLSRSAEVSRAIKHAVHKGILAPGSTARRLTFTGDREEAS